MAAQVHGLEIGKDVILKNMPIGEQMALPKGIDAVVPWDAGASVIRGRAQERKIIDSIYPYNMYEGNFVVRQELVDNVPDVVQALSDAYVESLLWTRLNHRRHGQASAGRSELEEFLQGNPDSADPPITILYKPTFVYPHAKFWGEANEPIFNWLYQQKRIQRPLEGGRLRAIGRLRASWTRPLPSSAGHVPKTPPFMPADWKGSLENCPIRTM